MREETAPLVDESRARKRQAIGLNPYRPTAKAEPVRPPSAQSAEHSLGRWAPVLLLLGLILVTLLLIGARLFNSPIPWNRSWQSTTSSAAVQSEQGSALLIDEFDAPSGLLAEDQLAGRWTFTRQAALGTYEIRIQSGQMAWSILGATDLPSHRLEATLTIADVTPAGQASVVARFQDAENFYWFAIDGQGRFQVQQYIAGTLQTIATWSAHPAIQPAGQANRLALIDTGAALQFVVNGELLLELAEPVLPLNRVGIGGAAEINHFALIELDWLRVQPLSSNEAADE
jgi:hypothetical protein